MKRLLAAAVVLSFAASQAQAQQALAFAACPILRDAAVPCWLAEYKGELYSLDAADGATDAASAPSLGHQALIEGTPTGQTRCGGKVLSGLHVSVLPARDADCDLILPATDTFQNTSRPPGPDPRLAPQPAPPPSGPPPAGSQKFEVLYDFDGETAGRQTQLIAQAAAYSRANPKAEVHVRGFRAAVKLAGGQVLTEDEAIGLRRARDLLETLVTLGADRNNIYVVDSPGIDLGDYTLRRAVIEVVMSGGDEPDSEH